MPGEIGCYAPGQDLVLNYGDQAYFSGIVRVGHLNESIAPLAGESDGLTVRVEKATR